MKSFLIIFAILSVYYGAIFFLAKFKAIIPSLVLPVGAGVYSVINYYFIFKPKPDPTMQEYLSFLIFAFLSLSGFAMTAAARLLGRKRRRAQVGEGSDLYQMDVEESNYE